MRSKKTSKKQVQPDPIYQDQVITKLINASMYHGKKDIAAKHVYQTLQTIKQKTKKDELEYIKKALENISPQMEVRSRRVGGASYQVPMTIRPDRRQSLAIRWLIQAARQRPNKEHKTYAAKLTAELIDAYQNQGTAIKKKLDTHKMAEANKAFSHLRW